MRDTIVETKTLCDTAIQALEEIKGQQIVLMDLREVESAVSDYFVICTGTSDRHVQSLADSVLDEMKKMGEIPISKEGIQHGEWVLLDYASLVIHIFQQDQRDFYRLEDLWGDASFTTVGE